MFKKANALFVVFFLLNAACATIIKGGKQQFAIRASSSDVKDAKVKIFKTTGMGKGMEIDGGSLPMQTTLKTGDGYFSGASYRIEVEAPGYETKKVNLDTSVRWGWYGLGNIIFGGLIGYLIVDPMTGAMWALDTEDDEVIVRMNTSSDAPKKKALMTLPDSETLTVMSISDVPEHLKKKMKRIN